jgi:hypothetical protein
MPRPRARRIAWLLVMFSLAEFEIARAEDAWASAAMVLAAGLPRCEMQVRSDPAARRVTARERVTFTNCSSALTQERAGNNFPIHQESSVGGWGGVFDAPGRGHP